ncbi:uncharacterized protein LOC115335285 [Aquila chrysaetos chrysaetos]|uniref:uncharacterized protein LOC115335285 n=1 Tax=Aquila chrysaetos chrysaetos TaxID=223781 RepID=UPI00117691EE|nr:uncharacterized protein LOC115335285 [Aquila chrysaetos chrysaetos]
MRLRLRSPGTAWEARPAGEGGSATPRLGGGSLPFPPGQPSCGALLEPSATAWGSLRDAAAHSVLAPALACFPLAGAGPPALEVTRVGELPQSFQRRDRLLGSALAGRNPPDQAPGGAASDARFCPPQPAAALRGAGRLPPGRPNPAVMGCRKPGPLELAGRGPCCLKPGGRWQVFASPRMRNGGVLAHAHGLISPAVSAFNNLGVLLLLRVAQGLPRFHGVPGWCWDRAPGGAAGALPQAGEP